MRKSMWSKIVLIVAIAFFAGCKIKKQAVTSNPKPSVVVEEKAILSKADVLKNTRNRQANYNTASIKAKTKLSINNRENDITMNIRMQKDKIIWVSVTAIAGLEVARALITPDSIKILNRIEGSYIKKPFNYIHQFTNQQINLTTLQSILVGNFNPEFISDQSDVNPNNGQPVLSGVLEGLSYLINFNSANKVVKTTLKDLKANQELNVRYSEFNAVSDQVLPFSVDINSVANSKQVDIQLSYNQLSIDETLEFPFNIPKRFTEKK